MKDADADFKPGHQLKLDVPSRVSLTNRTNYDAEVHTRACAVSLSYDRIPSG